ncbi:putative DNA helicase Ino80 [Ditylenchus destructor]|nr:putative DNA helicase Ino80 [Ditylenchus destructor]
MTDPHSSNNGTNNVCFVSADDPAVRYARPQHFVVQSHAPGAVSNNTAAPQQSHPAPPQIQHAAPPPPQAVRLMSFATLSASTGPPVIYSTIPATTSRMIDRPKSISRKRRFAIHPRLEHLEKMLDLTKFIDQLERLIEQPIKIPSTLSMVPACNSREKQIPGKAKRELLSVEDIWENKDEQKADTSSLYNTSAVGEERKWLLDLLLEESDPDSGGDEHITQEDLKVLLKIHQRRRKYQKDYHSDILNSQYTYYGAGLISENDRFLEHKSRIKEEFN